MKNNNLVAGKLRESLNVLYNEILFIEEPNSNINPGGVTMSASELRGMLYESLQRVAHLAMVNVLAKHATKIIAESKIGNSRSNVC